MANQSSLTNSSLGRKLIMALSGLFLISFLLLHFGVNFVSLFSEEAYNIASEFMGTNWIVQFILQPVLVLGVIVHFVMGMILEVQNRKARGVNYAMYKGSANSTWMSRNMIYSGLVVLAFLVLHFIDFWVPEMQLKYFDADAVPDAQRYYHELKHQFVSPLRVTVYVISFVLLAMHLLHGFQSSFQSMGVDHPKYSPTIKRCADAFAVLISLGFIVIALYHHFTPH